MGRAGSRHEEPMRQCVVSRQSAPQSALLRLLLGPEGRLVVDVLGRAPGRGIYVAPEALTEVLSPKGLARAFRGRAQPLGPGEAAELVAEARMRLLEQVESLLGLARRAGAVTLGVTPTCRRLGAEPGGAVVVLAEDLSPRTTDRVGAAMAASGHEPRTVSTRARLGAALGRETLGVIGVWHPVLGPSLMRAVDRWAALERAAGPGTPAERTRKND